MCAVVEPHGGPSGVSWPWERGGVNQWSWPRQPRLIGVADGTLAWTSLCSLVFAGSGNGGSGEGVAGHKSQLIQTVPAQPCAGSRALDPTSVWFMRPRPDPAEDPEQMR